MLAADTNLHFYCKMYKKPVKKEQFRDALARCLHRTSFQNVTISDLSRESGVSRVTFYRYFDNTTDVLEYLCDSLFDEAQQHPELMNSNGEDLFVNLLNFLMERTELLEAIYNSRRLDIFQRSLSSHINDLSKTILSGASEIEAAYLKAAYGTAFASALAGIISVWAEHGRKESPEQILAIFKKRAIL